MRLLEELDKKPLLYYSVEEALECAKIGYYGIGIIAFSQLLNLFREKTPEHRHLVAHEFLRQRPSKEMLEETVAAFKNAASKQSDRECRKRNDIPAYQQLLFKKWKELIKKLHGLR
jgi:hypothetical protein